MVAEMTETSDAETKTTLTQKTATIENESTTLLAEA